MSLLTLAWFAAGLAALVAGAELLVRGASRLAGVIGISSLVIGLTVVAYGTSSPELVVSLRAGLTGSADIALGNVVGSNICNVLLILGLAATARPLIISRQLIRRDVPLMIALSALVLLMGLDGRMGRFDGLVLAGGCVVYTVWSVRQGRRENRQADSRTADPCAPPGRPAFMFRLLASCVAVVTGLALLVTGGGWVVNGAVEVARYLGLSELIIGLTIVAVGTSLPEVATSVVAGLRGHADMAVGNVVGSNIFNILLVLGLAATIAPAGIRVSPEAMRFDLPVMAAVAVACLPIFVTGGAISRAEGVFFLSYYAAYVGCLLLKAGQHRPAGPFDTIAMIFVVPPVLIGVVLTARLAWRRVRR